MYSIGTIAPKSSRLDPETQLCSRRNLRTPMMSLAASLSASQVVSWFAIFRNSPVWEKQNTTSLVGDGAMRISSIFATNLVKRDNV